MYRLFVVPIFGLMLGCVVFEGGDPAEWSEDPAANNRPKTGHAERISEPGWRSPSTPMPWPRVDVGSYPHYPPKRPERLTDPKARPWRSGRALAVHGDELFVVSTDTDQLIVMDRITGFVTRVVEVGARPEQVVVGPDGTAFVSVRYANTVVRVPPGARDVSRAEIVGTEPYGLALNDTADRLFVSLSGEARLVALAASDLSTQQSWKVTGRPRGIAFSDSRVWITDQFGGLSRFIDHTAASKTYKLRSATPVGLWGLGEKSGDRRVGMVLATTPHPSNNEIYAAHTLTLKADPALVLSGSGGTATNSGSEGARYYGPPQPTNKFPKLTRLVEATVSVIDPFSGARWAQVEEHPVMDPRTREPMGSIIEGPIDIHHHPTWSLLFMVGQGTDNVLAMSTSADPAGNPIAELRVGRAPRAIAFSADGASAYVLNGHSFTISHVDLRPLMLAHATTIHPTTLSHDSEATFAIDPMPEPMRAGRRAFTFARSPTITDRGEFSCNTCHFEGTDDKVTWVGTSGLRQTPTLAGRIKGSAPFNWKGTKNTLQDNMQQTIERMKGTGPDAHVLDSLALFMEEGLHLPPNPNLSPDGLTEEQLAGKTIFEDPVVGCAVCHPGGGTDGKQHQSGTLNKVEAVIAHQEGIDWAFNTPSLKGLFYTAPYMHNGSAEDLYQVLESNDMGNTAGLTPEERELLVQYLLTL